MRNAGNTFHAFAAVGRIAFLSSFLCTVKQTNKVMNKKAFYTIALFIITLASCCKVEMIERPAIQEEQDVISIETRVEDGSEYAFVRIGMYENVDNHEVIITDINIKSSNPSIEIPEFGSNFTEVNAISSEAGTPTFDMAEGDYHSIIPSGKAMDIIISFNALVKCSEGYYEIQVENAGYTIKSSETKWKSNYSYSYEICVDAQMLGLTEITFNPSVDEYEDVNPSN